MTTVAAAVNVIVIDLCPRSAECEDKMNTHYAAIHAHDRRADLLREARGGQLLAAANAATRDVAGRRDGAVEIPRPRFRRRVIAAASAVLAALR